MTLALTVIVPTHNPHRERLARTLAGLRVQTLPASAWELILVDNASQPALAVDDFAHLAPAHFRLVVEPQLGLTSARRCGFAAARGEFIVMVDDDNVLAPDYLEQTLAHFAAHPRLGACGGRSVGELESPRPAWWQNEFDGLLALRDLGDAPLFAATLRDERTGRNEYPLCAPIGAGMALRRSALATWLDDRSTATLPDRKGADLSSSGDNDIVLTILRAGWHLAYFPALTLTHLIPTGRVRPDYLARLNRGIARSWIRVLAKHDANPWPPIAPWTVPLRQAKAWLVYRAWSGPAQQIRWQGACGHFAGLADLH